MQSKLTLRIDEEVKEAAKRLAQERGESVSAMVETYFRILLDREGGEQDEDDGALDYSSLGPITRRIAGAFQKHGEPYHGDQKSDDRAAVVQAALEKHG